MSVPVAISTTIAIPPAIANRRPSARNSATRSASATVRRAAPTASASITIPPAQTAAPIRCSERIAVALPAKGVECHGGAESTGGLCLCRGTTTVTSASHDPPR